MTKATITNISVPSNEGIAEAPTVFTFEFDKDLTLTSATKIIFYINENQVIKTPREITKPLLPISGDRKKGTVTLIFPESLAGATLNIKYGITNPLINSTTLESNIKIKRADGLEEIEKVYWAEQEQAAWGAKLTERREIYKNETGFLHIYTKGMFGHQVWVELREYDNETAIRPIMRNKVLLQDNVLSIPYSMDSVLTTFKSNYSTFFERDCLELYARAHPDETKIDEGSKSRNLFLWYEKDADNPTSSTTVPPVIIKIESDEEESPERTKARCSLEFRPDDSWIGDYGFDWVHTGDTIASYTSPDPVIDPTYTSRGHHNDCKFDEHMGKHYHDAPHTDWTGRTRPSTNQIEHDGNNRGNKFQKDKDPNTIVCHPDFHFDKSAGGWVYTPSTVVDTTFGKGKMYRKLKLRYRRLIFRWKAADGVTPFETYTPIMTIMKGKTAKLDLLLDVKSIPEKIVFEYNNEKAKDFLKLPSYPYEINTNLAVGVDKTNHKLSIECLDEFDDEYTLTARAFVKGNPKGEVCAMLRILPNGKMYQHKIKIVLFRVITNINGSDNFGKTNLGKQRINEILGQALISADIEEVDLDARTSNFRSYCCKHDGSKYILDSDNKVEALSEYLEKKRDSKYDHYYKMYFFDEAGKYNGYSYGEKYTVIFNAANSDTPVHELLHSLQLAHPFDAFSKNTPFSYEFLHTDNIMDYGHWLTNSETGAHPFVRKSLFHWHWQILNAKIR